jgi:Raf kinase inhibitor-like YbhB/YbcL family protein
MTLTLRSDAFDDGEVIPRRYACDGDDVSPPIAWLTPPELTETFALIMDDPDAPGGVWVHWVVFNLPAETSEIREGGSGSLPGKAAHGSNSWGRTGYGGPCPPGGTHRYFFKLYALDSELDLARGAMAASLTEAMEGHVLGKATLMGHYSRST